MTRTKVCWWLGIVGMAYCGSRSYYIDGSGHFGPAFFLAIVSSISTSLTWIAYD